MATLQTYHGTSLAVAQRLQAGQVDVAPGGGELGQGFYMTEEMWVAKVWARNRFQTQGGVTEFTVDEDAFLALDALSLQYAEALAWRRTIRKRGATRTHKFDRNSVWSPIVGKKSLVHHQQHKFESKVAEALLNAPTTTRTVR